MIGLDLYLANTLVATVSSAQVNIVAYQKLDFHTCDEVVH